MVVLERETRAPDLSIDNIANDPCWLMKNDCRLAGDYNFVNDYVRDYYFNCLLFKELCFSDDCEKVNWAHRVLNGEEKISRRILLAKSFKYCATCMACKLDGKPACGKKSVMK